MNQNDYCPNCVTKLEKSKKKLGRYSVWLLCPNCGYRTRPNEHSNSPNLIKRINNQKRILDDEANGYYNES